MDSGNNTLTDEAIKTIIYEAYVNYVYNLVVISVVALLIYVPILRFSTEVENIWSRRFSVPSLLYVLARYPAIITQALYFVINTLPLSAPEQTCNIIYNVASAFSILSFIGIQGLLVARTYAVCQGGKVVAVALGFSFFVGIFFLLLEDILFATCTFVPSVATSERIVDLLGNIAAIVIDLLSFGLCLWKVWGTWKSKRELNIQGNNDLVSILLRQVISRFCFTILISVTYAIIGQFLTDTTLTAALSSLQAAFSVILISDFTLDLRKNNSSAIETNNTVTLPSMGFTDVLQHIHQTLIVELGDEDGMNNGEGVSSDMREDSTLENGGSSPV